MNAVVTQPKAKKNLKKAVRACSFAAARHLTKRQQTAFMKRTLSVYSTMRTRFRKTLKIERDLPFELDHLRDAVVSALGNPCQYCENKLSISNFSLDHSNPVNRGGSLGKENLDVICKGCNTAKGEMTRSEFDQLLLLLNSFESITASDILGRLKAGAAVKRLQFCRK